MEINEKTERALENIGPVVGIATNAFSRVVPSFFLKDYEIVSSRWHGETAFAMRDNKVFCLEKEYPKEIICNNTWKILGNKKVQDFINKKGHPWLLIYCPDPRIEKICQENGWKPIANKSSLKAYFDNKKVFREVLEKAGVGTIPGETLTIEELTSGIFEEMLAKYGKKLVFQMAEVTGGGLGTAFVETKEELLEFIEKVKRNRIKKPELKHVNVSKYINGIPSSIVCCATKYGVLAGPIQAQIQDISEVIDLTLGSGVFCGHDWSFFAGQKELTQKAQEMAQKIGNIMYAEGYRGIFGLDLLVENETGKLYAVECNPRYTDAFPAISMMHLQKKIMPLDLYHILELTDKEYEVDIVQMNKLYGQPVFGSQIIISNRVEVGVKLKGELKAGVYRNGEKELEYVRDGYRYEDLENDDEFVVTEGVPSAGTRIKGGYRIIRLIFKSGILKAKNQLTDEAINIVKKVYNRLSLEKIE